MRSLFISDLHLSDARPEANEKFISFVEGQAQGAQALYILGDLFEYWIGDDDLAEPFNAMVAGFFTALGRSGVQLRLMHGNRDFLIGERFCAVTGAQLLEDPCVIDLDGEKTLLMHGDTLCTDDVEYQKFRAYAHDSGNQRRFLAQPLPERRRQVLGMRADSEKSKQQKSAEIMDVTVATVESMLRRFGYPRLIHGHTHRPGRHVHVVDGRNCERWVLSDWYERGGYLRCDANGCTAIAL